MRYLKIYGFVSLCSLINYIFLLGVLTDPIPGNENKTKLMQFLTDPRTEPDNKIKLIQFVCVCVYVIIGFLIFRRKDNESPTTPNLYSSQTASSDAPEEPDYLAEYFAKKREKEDRARKIQNEIRSLESQWESASYDNQKLETLKQDLQRNFLDLPLLGKYD